MNEKKQILTIKKKTKKWNFTKIKKYLISMILMLIKY